MKKSIAILTVLFLLTFFGSAMAETCNLDGLTFDIPMLFFSSDEVDGFTTYVQYFTQSYIVCASTELNGMTLEESIEDLISEMGSAITNLDRNCEVNGISYVLVDLNMEDDENSGQGKAAIFVDDSKLYAIIYTRTGILTDYDLNNFDSILQSVKMDNPQSHLESTTEQDKKYTVEYAVNDIKFTSPVGFDVIQEDSDALIFSNEDDTRIRVTIGDTEGLTTETAAQMMAYELAVQGIQYDTTAEIRGVPYVDYTIADASGPYYGKAAMIIDWDTNTAYKLLYLRQTELTEKDYENWDFLLNSIQAPNVLLRTLKDNNSMETNKPTSTHDSNDKNENVEVYEALQKGDKGDNVKRLQEALISLGYLNDTADGNFGSKTEKAVEAYQKAKGLQVTKVADHPTLVKIYEEETALQNIDPKIDDENISNTVHIPTIEPTAEPTPVLTVEPTEEPVSEATIEPINEPILKTTIQPMVEPTLEPTIEPKKVATLAPIIGMNEKITGLSSDNNNPQTIIKEISGSEVGSVFYDSNDCTMTLNSIDQEGCKILVENNSLNNYGFCVHSLAINGFMTDCNPYMSSVDIPSGKKGYINIDFYDRLITYAPNPPYNNISLLLWVYDKDKSYKGFETEVISLIIDPNVNENLYNVGTQLIEDSGLIFSVLDFTNDYVVVSVVNNNDYYIDYDLSNTTVNGWAMDTGLDVYNVSLFPGCQSLFTVTFKPVKQDTGIEEINEFEFTIKTRRDGSYYNEENTGIIQFTQDKTQFSLQSNDVEVEENEAQSASDEGQESVDGYDSIDYKDVERNPNQYKGKSIKVKGIVRQVSEGWFNSVTMRVDEGGGDMWYITYTRTDKNESRILEGDELTFYGECDGVRSYTTVLGSTVTIPSLKAVSYK